MTRPMSIEMINESGRSAVMISIERASVLLDPADVDAVIQYLSLLRASMQPPVPETPSRSEQYVVEMDPCWYTEQHALYGGAVLFLRHTGLGWSGFALPPRSLERLHESLGHHLEALREPSGLPN
ncbi:hypothetical protein [Burkholderia glumae]|uniref:Uncharacterized protein n=1 Tax=Burkholderia glumae TaxID=337 RepID=A0AAP9Y1P1_BURGL|nr:hypothetical protein [Burkholderia glumae]ACR30348.1 Hypothetical protein bglu_1g32860 [Burkholderia glumae BGR1]AJY67923.1 hypothetical protein KS03_746 [Burkholderia glumae LMG 2196 = ATCC 33617]KHJ63820.1 hypothetical protein NCPPB3923_06135 [Burkholderia glumae]MCM2482001.1 hypothetical protein [Burkholderia glumae]MCM2491401.1 hypothetical protein [Burkholderia glumae]